MIINNYKNKTSLAMDKISIEYFEIIKREINAFTASFPRLAAIKSDE